MSSGLGSKHTYTPRRAHTNTSPTSVGEVNKCWKCGKFPTFVKLLKDFNGLLISTNIVRKAKNRAHHATTHATWHETNGIDLFGLNRKLLFLGQSVAYERPSEPFLLLYGPCQVLVCEAQWWPKFSKCRYTNEKKKLKTWVERGSKCFNHLRVKHGPFATMILRQSSCIYACSHSAWAALTGLQSGGNCE